MRALQAGRRCPTMPTCRRVPPPTRSIVSTARTSCTASARPPSPSRRARCGWCAGRGIYVWDSEGRRYIDGLSSLWNVAVGHGRGEIARAVAAQIRALEFAPTLLGFSSEPAIRLAARIARMAPKGLRHVMFTSGGSESNESVIRLVRLYWRLRGKPDKIGIVALRNAYHGTSSGAASLTGLAGFHRYYEPQLPEVSRIPRPYCYRCELGKTYPSCQLACADELEALVAREGADRIGAVIAEPVQGVGGVVIPPPGWFERIRAICDRHDLLLVVDEVITGFGRLGKPFGIQCSKVTPDLLVVREGRHQRLPAARRRHPARARLPRARRGRPGVHAASRLHVLRASRWPAPRRWRTSTSSSARTWSAPCAATRRTSSAGWKASRPCPSSARCAPPG